MKQTFFIPGWFVKNYPDTIEEVLKGTMKSPTINGCTAACAR